MADLLDLPWTIAAPLVFLLRVGDVSLGTVRTICVVQGRLRLSFLLGFFEVLLWLLAVSWTLTRVATDPLLMAAYAGGFAAGTATGILLERWLALGMVIIRLVTERGPDEIAARLLPDSERVVMFPGRENGRDVTLLYAVCRRGIAPELVARAQTVDPEVFFAIDTVRETNAVPLVQQQPTGWRAVFKMK